MMDQAQVLAVLDIEIEAAKNYSIEQIGYERAYTYDRYYGRPLGDEIDGQSAVCSQEVSEAIDSAVPQLVEMFISSDRAVEFTPRRPDAVPLAEQATDSCNYVFYTQNNGYKLVHDGIKDGLLQKTGAYCWYWEPPRLTAEDYEGLSDQELMILAQDPEATITAHSQYPDPNTMPQMGQPGMGNMPQPMRHDVTVTRKKGAGRVCIRTIPPEELLISPRSTGLDVYDMPFIGYAPLLTRSELIELGYDRALVDGLTPGDDLLSTDPARIARQARLNQLTIQDYMRTDSEDHSTDRFRYYLCYLRIDEDGDGIAELRCIAKVGNQIIYDKPTDHIPLSVWTPKIMPHEPVGISMGDDVADQQVLATVLWRQSLNSLYLSLMPRMYVNEDKMGQTTLDDVLNVRAGGVVMGKGPMQDVCQPFALPNVSANAFQMIEYVKQEIESRTGIPRYIQGFDPDSLNQTKGGMQILQSNAQARLKMYARNFAELCLKPLFRGILYLLSKNQQEPLILRLRNSFIPVDPRAWQTEYDMTVNVGLGSGGKDQQLMHLQALSQDIAMVAQSPYGPQLVGPGEIFNLFEKKSELAGFKDATKFMKNPANQPPPPPQPPPLPLQIEQMRQDGANQREAMKMQANQGSDAVKAQTDVAKHQMKSATDAELAREEMAMEAQLEQFRTFLRAQLDNRKALMQHHANMMRPAPQGMQ